MVQQNIGMRRYVMPLVRSFSTVVTRLMPATSVLTPEISSDHK